jgi:hypothetical protein
MTRTPFVLAMGAITLLALPACRCAAQAPPFFAPGAGIFDPEISTVQSGVVLDAQAVVSADRKYVTMTTRFQLTDLIALREFAFQTGAGGVGGQVGGAPAQGVGRAGGGAVGVVNGAGGDDGAAAPGAMRGGGARGVPYPAFRKPYPKPGETGAADTSSDHGGSILDKPGMTLVGRIEPRPAAGGERSHR